MATPNRWAIRDAGITTFYNLSTGKPVVTLRTLKTSGIETTSDKVFVSGGFGNPRILSFSSNKQSTITLQDAIFDNKALAMLTGNDMVTGATNVVKTETVTVASNAATLVDTPVGTPLGVYGILADGTLDDEVVYTATTPITGEYKIAGSVLTFFSGDFANGSKVMVYYTVATDASAKTLKVTSDKFGGSYRVIMDCIVRDELTDEDYAAQITIHKASIVDQLNLALSADGDAATLDINLDVLRDTLSNEMWTMKIYDQGTLV